MDSLNCSALCTINLLPMITCACTLLNNSFECGDIKSVMNAKIKMFKMKNDDDDDDDDGDYGKKK